MNLSDATRSAFADAIQQFELGVSGSDTYQILKNDQIEIRVTGGMRELNVSIMHPTETCGLPLTTLVTERGGEPATFLPDANTPIPDLEAYRNDQLVGYAKMTTEFLAEPLAGSSDWFTKRMDELGYEHKLKTYVFNHAPMQHPARRALRAPFWKEEAEKFIQEVGVEL